MAKRGYVSDTRTIQIVLKRLLRAAMWLSFQLALPIGWWRIWKEGFRWWDVTLRAVVGT